MTELGELMEISAVAEELALLSEEQIQSLWMRLQDHPTATRRIFQRAAHAERLRRSLFVSNAREAT